MLQVHPLVESTLLWLARVVSHFQKYPCDFSHEPFSTGALDWAADPQPGNTDWAAEPSAGGWGAEAPAATGTSGWD